MREWRNAGDEIPRLRAGIVRGGHLPIAKGLGSVIVYDIERDVIKRPECRRRQQQEHRALRTSSKWMMRSMRS
jgi:hypothetical protein